MTGQKNFIKQIISSPVIQTFLIYVSGGWIVLEMSDFFIDNYNLNEKVRDLLLVIFIAGLPLALFFTWHLGRDRKSRNRRKNHFADKKNSSGIVRALRKRPLFTVPSLVILALLLITGTRFVHKKIMIRWARFKALPEMELYVNDMKYVKAFEISRKAEKYIPNDSAYMTQDLRITRKVTILTDPPGADVFYKPYTDVEGEWDYLGKTPIIDLLIPNWSYYRWRFVKDGYSNVMAASSTFGDTLFRRLQLTENQPEGMVYVEGIREEVRGDYMNPAKHGFFIDKYEVTNKDFKEFVDQGGYRDPMYWNDEFVFGDDTLTLENALSLFADRTGRPGPSTWSAGDYPDGQDDYPVNGISWYEAAAYASFVGKELPTYWHWRSAHGLEIPNYWRWGSSIQVPLSNMNGDGTEPVGANPAISPFGAYDMTGNVREWCFNKASDEPIIYGGAWDDVDYMSTKRSQLSGFDRSPKNGFRCAVYPNRDNIPELVFQDVPSIVEYRDYTKESPVSDLEYNIYKKLYAYDKTELESRLEERDDGHAEWIMEKVSFTAAYENERMIAYLFLPRNSKPPFQPVIYYPGTNVFDASSLMDYNWDRWFFDFIPKNGRAVVVPVFKGTLDRQEGPCNWELDGESHQFRECGIKWVQDLSRTIDYLEGRMDMDTSRIGYLGFSWGGEMGGIVPALEDRLKTCVLVTAGLPSYKQLPEIDQINFVSHVTLPVLMLCGKYDVEFPYELSIAPMFELLGTQKEDKKLIMYESDHIVPKTEIIREALAWYDKYLGHVK